MMDFSLVANVGIVISHTHWDRAWYLPFQAFRLRLVRTVDQVLNLLESDQSYKCYTLDGQVVVLEDYLEIRPENQSRIQRLIEAERLFVGPWYSLPDLFIPGEESIVRNLQLGLRISQNLGSKDHVGYVPDPFGHPAQLPQILKKLDIHSFIFMRGRPQHLQKENLFKWVAPDDTTIDAFYLQHGYFAFSAIGHNDIFGRFQDENWSIDTAKERLRSLLEKSGDQLPVDCFPNGGDHMPPQKNLTNILKQLNETNDKIELHHGSYQDFIQHVKSKHKVSLTTYQGDLIGNAEHPLLRNVLSARMDLKHLNYKCETYLVRYIEPLISLMDVEGVVDATTYQPFLEKAWKMLLKNHAHDDICGCSHDEVHRNNKSQFEEVLQLADSMITEILEGFTLLLEDYPLDSKESAFFFLFNPHPTPFEGTFHCELFIDDPDLDLTNDFTHIEVQGDLLEYKVKRNAFCHSQFLQTSHGQLLNFATKQSLPPLGYKVIKAHLVKSKVKGKQPQKDSKPNHTICNAYHISVVDDVLTITNQATGKTLTNPFCFELEDDVGDTYSFSPPPEISKVQAQLRQYEFNETGCRLSYEISSLLTYEKPKMLGIDVFISDSTESGISLKINYTNTFENCRLRVIFMIPFTVEKTFARGFFHVGEHQLIREEFWEGIPEPKYPGELKYADHHQGDFLYCCSNHDKFWIANRGNPEYQILENINSLGRIAVTLHRSVGKLSVSGGRIRSCHAGPGIDTPEAQCLLPFSHNFAFGFDNLSVGHLMEAAEKFSKPPLVRQLPFFKYLNKTQSSVPNQMEFLQFKTKHIHLVSLRPCEGDPGVYAMRCVNLSDQNISGKIHLKRPPLEARSTNLLEVWNQGEILELNSNQLTLNFKPFEVQTVLLKFANKTSSEGYLQ